MDWRTVQSATTGVDKYCVEGRHSGGVWIVSDIFRDPYVSVYIYEAGSPFENVMNQYMITGKGINPFNPRGLGAEGIALNATVAGATLGGNAVLTATEVGSVPTKISPAVTGMGPLGVELEIGSR
ncbi:hypothetical protein HO133_002879 [Letharia lupina]|uniref:Uncharacterized protein n=1 Tax=Letharia lupina TaxID=560253 RepID=A0A8H6F9P5_9LECA|nr:uncharacterized protein HO133_002879 [Letharia lupina]KAF6220447.1 hypothetical protein HO133_002879 [Letharia lupina]